MKRTLVLAAVLSFLSLGLLATDIFVTPTGGGNYSGSSWSNAINGGEYIVGLRIRDAITNAFANSAEEINVYLAGGTYTTTNQISLSGITIPVKLSGGYKAEKDGSFEKSDEVTTFKRSTYNIRFVYISALSSFTVENITFTGGCVAGNNQGGALHFVGSTSLIENCIFSNNSVTKGSSSYYVGKGGAVYATGGSMTVKGSRFSGNYIRGGWYPHWGGAICTIKNDITLDGCVFEGNYLDPSDGGGVGGAININGGHVVIKKSTFNGNYASANHAGDPLGGALAIRSATKFEMSDCKLIKNYIDGYGVDNATAAGCYFDDFNATDGVMTASVVRCVFDSSSVPVEKLSMSDIFINCGHLYMTNCLITGARGANANMQYSLRVRRVAFPKTASNKLSGSQLDLVSKQHTIIADCSLNLVNCTISDGSKNGVAAIGDDVKLNLENCISWGNALTGIVNATSVKYTCSQEEQEGEGNFVADPLWTGKPYYHLVTKAKNGYIQDGYFGGTFNGEKSAVSSPCIDAGITNAPNHIFEPHAKGRRINLGAYGGTPWASKTYYQLGTHLRLQ